MAGRLIRDNTADIIRSSGSEAITRKATNEEYWGMLFAKLYEVIENFKDDLNAEALAEIHEVLLAMTHDLSISPAAVEKKRQELYKEFGGYLGTVLMEVRGKKR